MNHPEPGPTLQPLVGIQMLFVAFDAPVLVPVLTGLGALVGIRGRGIIDRVLKPAVVGPVIKVNGLSRSPMAVSDLAGHAAQPGAAGWQEAPRT